MPPWRCINWTDYLKIMSKLNELADILMSQMRGLTEEENPDRKLQRLEEAKVVANMAKAVVAAEKVKVDQARLLMDAGLPAEVGGLVFEKADRDAHPRILRRGGE